ncbi:MAG TPA: MBL fold metallo-hydrolase [Polyangiaceae bacterium]
MRASPHLARALRIAAGLAVVGMVLLVVSPLLQHPETLGGRNWDQMNTQRAVVAKTILRFHQLPFWDPYTCGGRPAWGSLEGDPVLVSPFLPALLLFPLATAIRVEIVVMALVAAAGCWLLASRFTRSSVLCAAGAVLGAVNSRWALQIAAGHTWHLHYGLLPWVLYFFDRAIDPGASRRTGRRDAVLAAVCLAVMVYGDAIYPVPHTALALVLYGVLVAGGTRSLRPLRALALVAVVSLGLSAPKLLPLYETMQRYPRWIDSSETLGPWGLLKVLTWRVGDYEATTSFTRGLWHEWGLYLGWPALVALVVGVAACRGARARALALVGLAMVVLALGSFSPLAPWSLLHRLPVFKSQHAPSRWLYPAVMLLSCAAAAGADRLLRRTNRPRALVEAGIALVTVLVAIDMGTVARRPVAQSFVNAAPDVPDATTPFHVEHRLPPVGGYRPGLWDIATLPGVFENVGTMECDTDLRLHSAHRDEDGRMPGVGAYGDDDPEYRGEVYVAETAAAATITSWTPNDVTVHVEHARPGDHLVLNQNWDPGWRADEEPAPSYRDAVAAVIRAPDEDVRFRFRPPGLGWGLVLLGATAVGIALLVVPSWRRAGVLLLVPGALAACSRETPGSNPSAVPVPEAPASAAFVSRHSTDRFHTDRGELVVTLLDRASVLLGWDGKAIYLDPTSRAIADASLPKADVIVLTHDHYDACDPVAVSRLEKPGSVVVGPPSVTRKTRVDVVMRNGDVRDVAGMGVVAVPMYNVRRGPGPGLLYHPPGRGNGYVLDLAGTHVYFSGDSECTPEMKALEHVDIAFVSVGLPSTMPPEEAAECLRAMHPRVAFPYHQPHASPELVPALAGSGIDVREREGSQRNGLARRLFGPGRW